MGAVLIGRDIVVVDQTPSTNDAAYQLAVKGAREGLVVFAEYQSAGRGQRGNKWQSPPGKGLCFSILLQPSIPVQDSARLTTWVAECVASTVAVVCQLQAKVKPPNDVYIKERKIAGVLVEMRAQPGTAHCAIVGIGLNVNETEKDFPEELSNKAASLAMLTGCHQDRNAIAVALLRNLDASYGQIRDGCSPGTMR
jgi:BirA family biotin operon repressor/biotin-[acetyl-CoA-carboxylase] ligase